MAEPTAERTTSVTELVAERLYRARTVILSGEIDQRLAANVSAQLLALSAESPDPITIYLNSQGGHVESGDMIHDMIRYLAPRVRIVGTGWVASAGALIFVSVPREDRFCLPNTRFLLHQPAGGAGGTASDIQIEAREILRMRDRLEPDLRPSDGPAARADRGGHAPRLLAHRRGSAALRHRGEDHRQGR